MEVILNINNLEYENIFKDLSIYIEKNTITTISGPNNCGKTTLFRILNRDIETNLNIVIDGKNINSYEEKTYDEKIQVVFPNKLFTREKNLIDELRIQNSNIDEEKISFIISELKLKKYQKCEISKLSEKNIILLQIAKAILNSKEIVCIDELDYYFNNEELKKLCQFFYKCIEKYDLTFILSSQKLDLSIYTKYLYIINNGKIALKGESLKVLEKDNILNKIGLELPFMIDLSVKLKDYDLINKIYTDKKELIDALWN